MNKYEKSLKEISNILDHEMFGIPNPTHRPDYVLQELVERATPMKVIYNECVNVAGNCPVCNGIIEEGHQYKFHRDEGKIDFCPHCGQALDWNDNNE